MSKRERAMSSEEIALHRIPMAHHEAGHTVMGYWVGCNLGDTGVVVDMTREKYRAVMQMNDAPVKEHVMTVMAGHLAVHHWMVKENGERAARDWQARGGPGPLTKPQFLEKYFAACLDVDADVDQRDDWKLAMLMIGGELNTNPDARSLDRFKARCDRYQSEAIKQIRLPLVWNSVCKIASGLISHDRLSETECRLLLGDDFDALKDGYHRQGSSV
jgi:hypothetical protein